MKHAAYIFDLDGTLLDTLPDLVNLTNMVLERCGWPTCTRDEILGFVGGGGRNLLGLAAPEGTAARDLDEAFALWKGLYPAYGHANTAPYAGIDELLGQLKAAGAKLGVLSNKFDAAAKSVVEEHFPGVFDLVRGEREGVPRKPDPAGLLGMMRDLGVRPDETAYVGDSQSDIATARAAGTTAIAVMWGYQQPEGADLTVSRPGEIIYNEAVSNRKDLP